MTLRRATAGDAAAVLALERATFGVDAWSEESVGEELTGAARVALVACDPEVVGYAVTRTSDRVADLQRLAVHRGHRRRGLARQLLAALTDREEVDRMLLEVSATNQAALAFYAAEGFVEIHRRCRYYRDGSDAVVMELVL